MRGKTIRQRVVVSATPAEVYATFVDAKKHSAFTGSKATCDARVGGEFTAWDGYISGKNLLLEEGERIVQEWITTEWPEGFPPSRLELTFTKVRGGTEILMVHSGVPAELADEIADGWNEFYWEPLKKYFEKWTSPSRQRKCRRFFQAVRGSKIGRLVSFLVLSSLICAKLMIKSE